MILQCERPSVYRLMADDVLALAAADLERQAVQLQHLRHPAPAALRAGIEDALLQARAEIARRAGI